MSDFDRWQEVNLELLDAIDKDDFDKVNILFDKRQEILNNIDINEIKNYEIDFNKELKVLLEKKIENIKQEIQSYRLTKNANYSYKRNLNKKINIFNEKV